MPVENTDAVVESQKGKPRAIIYFQRDQTKTAKEIANALRSNSKIANLVFANLFIDAADCEKCEAVAIQATSPRVHIIAKAYMKTFPDVELHYFDDDGEFVEGPQIEDKAKFEMPILNKNKAVAEPTPPSAEEIAAAKAALVADAGKSDEEAIPTDTQGSSDPATEDASDPDDAAEAEAADDAESEEGDDGRGKSTKS